MDENKKNRKDKPELGGTSRGHVWKDIKSVPNEELREVPDEARLVALVMLIKLIEELMGGLSRTEQRTWWLLFIEGKSIHQAALSENVTRQAIYRRLKKMARHHQYTALAFRFGRLRERVNQHEFRSGHTCRRRTSTTPSVQTCEVASWESEGGALADEPHFG